MDGDTEKHIDAEGKTGFFHTEWQKLEELALRIHLDLNYFWELDPNQFAKHLKIANEQTQEDLKARDYENYTLAIYIAYAINNPKQFPKKPFSHKEEEKAKEMDADEMATLAKKITEAMDGKIS